MWCVSSRNPIQIRLKFFNYANIDSVDFIDLDFYWWATTGPTRVTLGCVSDCSCLCLKVIMCLLMPLLNHLSQKSSILKAHELQIVVWPKPKQYLTKHIFSCGIYLSLKCSTVWYRFAKWYYFLLSAMKCYNLTMWNSEINPCELMLISNVSK